MTRDFLLFVVTGVFLINVASCTRCLRCDGVIQPRHCHTITDCSNDEECFVERYENERGEPFYNIGCRSRNMCQQKRSLYAKTEDERLNRRSSIICTECCVGEMCNAHGCGEPGFPSSRGPICYDCDQTRSPSACDTIKVCNAGEFCSIEEQREFGDVFYKTGCATKHICDLKTHLSGPIVGKRELGTKRSTKCNVCCSGDFCNENCNNTMVVSTTTTTTTITTAISTSTKMATGTSSYGAHTAYQYLLMFLRNYGLKPGNIEFIITTKSKTDVDMASLSTATFSRKNDIITQLTEHYNITESITSNPNFIEPKGISINTSERVTVYALSYMDSIGAAEGYLAIPVEKLGKEYKVISFPVRTYSSANDRSIFGIVGLRANTQINITFAQRTVLNGRTYTSGDVIQAPLGRLQTRSYESKNDLSGVLIQSSEPVGVLSGNTCNPFGGFGCNHMIEYLPPIKDLGTTFIVPNINASTDFTKVNIVTSSKKANVTLSSINSVNRYSVYNNLMLSPSQFKPYVIRTDEPVLISMYAHDSHHKTFMTLLPSTNQYSNDYIVSTPKYSNFTNYLAIIIETAEAGQLLFDNKTLSSMNLSPMSVSSNHLTWSVYTVQLASSSGPHTVIHPTSSVKFGLIQYGFKYGQAYAFPVGLDL